MFCTNCMSSSLTEIGSDIFVNDDNKLVENSQLKCLNCDSFADVLIINGTDIEMYGCYESPKEV